MASHLQLLDWSGCGLGLLGAYTLALNFRYSRYGWLAFLAANVAYIALASTLGVGGLLIQQIGFMGSSFLGVYRGFIVRQSELQAALGLLSAQCGRGEIIDIAVRALRADGTVVEWSACDSASLRIPNSWGSLRQRQRQR